MDACRTMHQTKAEPAAEQDLTTLLVASDIEGGSGIHRPRVTFLGGQILSQNTNSLWVLVDLVEIRHPAGVS